MTHPRVLAQMDAFGVDVLVLCGENNVAYATGRVARSHEPARGSATRTVAVLTRDSVDFLTPAPLDFDIGARELASAVDDHRGVVAVDEWPSLAVRDALRTRAPVDASTLLSQAKIVKTPDEVERIRAAQRCNEQAMDAVRPIAVPGARQTDLTAAFFRAVFELGASGNTVDPVWDLVPRSRAELAYTATGDLPFPTPTTDLVLARGDVCFTDAGIDLNGWASDVGRTWTIGVDPDARQLDQFERWQAVCHACERAIKPGATAADVARAATDANNGARPWFPHLYVAHGVGTDSAELPFCGTDLGPEIEDQVVLAAGTILVLEPVIWDEGYGGYRSEEIVVVTDDGCERLTHYTYAPYAS
ncbi:MAG TPA: M24 family metallopeptidase [Acidimicrobiia bacterium]